MKPPRLLQHILNTVALGELRPRSRKLNNDNRYLGNIDTAVFLPQDVLLSETCCESHTAPVDTHDRHGICTSVTLDPNYPKCGDTIPYSSGPSCDQRPAESADLRSHGSVIRGEEKSAKSTLLVVFIGATQVFFVSVF